MSKIKSSKISLHEGTLKQKYVRIYDKTKLAIPLVDYSINKCNNCENICLNICLNQCCDCYKQLGKCLLCSLRGAK